MKEKRIPSLSRQSCRLKQTGKVIITVSGSSRQRIHQQDGLALQRILMRPFCLSKAQNPNYFHAPVNRTKKKRKKATADPFALNISLSLQSRNKVTPWFMNMVVSPLHISAYPGLKKAIPVDKDGGFLEKTSSINVSKIPKLF